MYYGVHLLLFKGCQKADVTGEAPESLTILEAWKGAGLSEKMSKATI